MALRSLLTSWASGVWKLQSPRALGLHDAAGMRGVLDRELARMARSEIGFSVVFVDLARHQEEKVQQFASVARRRLRLTDEVGFTEDGRVALVLPETHRPQAAKVVKEIAASCHKGGFQIDYEIQFHSSPVWRSRAARDT